MDPAPGLVVVGHVTLDACEGGYLLGGAAYAALIGARLGYRVGLVTSFGSDLVPSPDLDGIAVTCQASPESTVFHNSYQGDRREQTLVTTALPVQASLLPSSWRDAPLALLAPMAGEVGEEWLDVFPGAVMGACPQGWLRRRGPQGRVEASPWAWAEAGLSRLEVLIVSLDDLSGDEKLASTWSTMVGCLVLTLGADGAWVYFEGGRTHVPAVPPSRVVDPTGAGDAFAAAFMVKWHEGHGPIKAGRFASRVASAVVEGKGLGGVPSPELMEDAWRRVATEV